MNNDQRDKQSSRKILKSLYKSDEKVSMPCAEQKKISDWFLSLCADKNLGAVVQEWARTSFDADYHRHPLSLEKEKSSRRI